VAANLVCSRYDAAVTSERDITWLLVGATLAVAACGGAQSERATPNDSLSSDPQPVAAGASATDAEPHMCEKRRDEAPVDLAIAADMRDTSEIDARLTPPLPIDWPLTDDRLQYFAYESRALPTGGIAYEIREPFARVVLESITESHTREPVAATPAVLGRRRDRGGSVDDPDAFAAAQQALLDVASQRRCPEDAREDLRGYCAWFALSDPIVEWAVPRQQSFVDWLGCSTD